MYSNHGPYAYSDSSFGPSTPSTNGYQQIPPFSSLPNHSSQQILSPYQQPQGSLQSQQNTGMYTRNLIGSLSASAFQLKDLQGKPGIWFILQDLSVRTEGWFRLKATFVNIGQTIEPDQPPATPQSNEQAGQAPVTGTAPVLATVFSQPFQVFSAKKFPGVIESTSLSREFARQGIKIPIRKDPQPKGGKAPKVEQESPGSSDEVDYADEQESL